MRSIGNTLGNQARKLKAVASGALPNGDPVVVNADGTVSIIEATSVAQAVGTPVKHLNNTSEYSNIVYDANSQKVVVAYRHGGAGGRGEAVVGTVDPSDNSISFGSATIFESGNTKDIAITYDSDSQKVILAYTDNTNSNRATAIVGTVSGTSISFGSATVFHNNECIGFSAIYDANAQKVVIAYSNPSNSWRGTYVVGTVSGTSISFGSSTVFESAGAGSIAATYDTNAQKIVIAYDSSSIGYAIVGTVSGTSITFGSRVQFNGAQTSDTDITYNSTAQKVVIVYKDNGNSDYGTAIVGTVSGDSISFGDEVVFETARADIPSISYDANADRVVISYQDVGNGSYGTAIVGTVSGTSISFGTPVVFESAHSYDLNNAYDANAQKVVIVYADGGNSSHGNSIVFQAEHSPTNLTAENYIGIASSGYADAQGATIDTQGSINSNQSGLTAGQAYYVQSDGTLNTTPDNPSVFAGTALTATKLLVKG